MSNVVEFRPMNTFEIDGVMVQRPKNNAEYLYLVKRFLNKKDYELIMNGILDSEYYDNLCPEHKSIVDNYYGYPV
jgi:hypothetical protein